jgi:hypothetical protein
MYFKNFPDIYYLFNIKNKKELKIIKDITLNVRPIKDVLKNIVLFDEYDLKDGETPEILSARLYGNAEYHWVIMLINEKYDYINDFPMTFKVFEEYIYDKYENPFEIKHYIDSEGYIVPFDSSPAPRAITHYDYELQLNESKRRIKIVSGEQLGLIVNQFKQLL